MAGKKIGILGSGIVGQQLALGFLKSGYEVRIGTRDAGKLSEWAGREGKGARIGSFEDAASFGELIFICTKWDGTENAIGLAGRSNFRGKVVVDVTNPLLFEKPGEAPKLAIGYPDSGGASIQRWLPEAKVVKAFNTVTAYYMANPKLQEGKPDLFIAGNDKEAKKSIEKIAVNWGWSVSDIGEIGQSYLLESLAMVWIMYGFLNNHWTHAFKLLRK